MKKIVLSLFAAATLVGCTTVEHVQTPEGRDLLDVTCNGFDHPANKCQRIANEECPGGYTLLSDTNASFGGWRNWIALGFNVQNSMVFQCHKEKIAVVPTEIKETITATKDKNGNLLSTTTTKVETVTK